MLLKGDPEEISTTLRGMEKDRRKIEKDIGTLVFYMQGGLSYRDAYMLSPEQFESLISTVTEHYEKQNAALNPKSKQ